MLPDFPTQKAVLQSRLVARFEQKVQERLGPFGKSPRYTNHEGDCWSLQGADGIPNERGYEALEVESVIALDEVPTLTLESACQRIDAAAEEMAAKATRKFLKELGETLESAGRTINAGGKGFTKELFLEALSSIEMSFDERGALVAPSLVVPSALATSIQANTEAWMSDPEFVARYDEIIARAREAWRDRESRRKLVD